MFQLKVVLLHLILQVGKHSQEKVPFEELILILNTRSFDKLANGAETLRDPIVILYIDQMILVLGVLILQDFPYASGDVEVGSCGKSSEVDLVGSEVSLAEVDEELK